MQSEKSSLSQKILTGSIFAVYFLLILLVTAFHEPWRDELQPWCIVRNLSVPEIFYQMRYEGHSGFCS